MNQDSNEIPSIDPNNDEKLMSFLRGELSADDEADFIQKLKSDPELKQHAVAVARLIKGLETEGIAADNQLKTAVKSRNKTRKLYVWLSAAAAIVVMLVLGVLYLNNSSTQQLAEEYQNEFPYNDIFRGAEDETNLKTLFSNVLENKDLDQTIISLSDCFAQSLQPTFNDYTNYMPQIGWYLAIAQLKANEKSSAKTTLKTLIDNTESEMLVHKKAVELMAKL